MDSNRNTDIYILLRRNKMERTDYNDYKLVTTVTINKEIQDIIDIAYDFIFGAVNDMLGNYALGADTDIHKLTENITKSIIKEMSYQNK